MAWDVIEAVRFQGTNGASYSKRLAIAIVPVADPHGHLSSLILS
jgi:hypothetical protein